MILVLSASSTTTQQNQPTYSFADRIGDTPEEVEQYALSYVRKHLIVYGTPQVVLVRPITQPERPALGLGCPQAKVTIEDPPQTLVILKGDFDVSGAMPGIANSLIGHVSYVAYIFDHWAGNYTTYISSRNGEVFRIALNDPTLPADGPEGESANTPLVCPTDIPYPVTRHYGDFAPPLTDDFVPPMTAKEVPTSAVTPIPTPIVPEAIPTYLSK